MSELRVDNIVSQDGSAAPIYSKGLNIGAGVTLTNNGDYVVGGATSIAGSVTSSSTGVVTLAGGVTVAGVTTVSNTLNVTGATNVTGALNVTGGGNFNNPSGIITTGTLNVSGATSFGDITGTISTLNVTNNATIGGNLTVNGDQTILNTTVLDVEDRIVGLSSVPSGTSNNSTANGSGMVVYGGADGDKKITLKSSTGNWDVEGGGLDIQGKGAATTGKAIAMAMVFGG